jgi:tungstate transport system substrate-binding protein
MRQALGSWAMLALLTLAAGAEEPGRLRLATTTSTADTGLLDVLLPDFERETGHRVEVIAVGTGKALKLGENGDADVVLVHAPEAEEAFVAAGFGVDRREVMRNDFLLVGPPEDPAGVSKAQGLEDALRRLKGCERPFLSRGDESGTHVRERALWQLVGGPPPVSCRLESGQGMAATLRMADEKRGYTLSDRGSFLALAASLGLRPLFEGDERLDNVYSVIAVSPRKIPAERHERARRFVSWITSPAAQARIGAFRVGGQALFRPTAAGSAPPD